MIFDKFRLTKDRRQIYDLIKLSPPNSNLPCITRHVEFHLVCHSQPLPCIPCQIDHSRPRKVAKIIQPLGPAHPIARWSPPFRLFAILLRSISSAGVLLKHFKKAKTPQVELSMPFIYSFKFGGPWFTGVRWSV